MPILNRPLRVMHIISGDLWAGAEVQAHTLLKHLQTKVELCVILLNEGELYHKLRGQGIQTILIPETNHSNFYIIYNLFKQIRLFNPDIIHTHRQKENVLGSIANLARAILSFKLTPSVRTAHGAPEFNPKGRQKIQVWLDRFVGLHIQKRVIAVSEDLGRKLNAIYPAKHIVVIHNGVDTSALKELARTPTEFRLNAPTKTHVGIIGRLEPVKRVDLFLEMAAILLKQQPNKWQFHVIGDGRLKNELEAQAASLGLTHAVTFHGHRHDIANCIGSLDAVIMCSDHEGTPMTALEAMAIGTPMIAHSIGGLPDIIEPKSALFSQNTTITIASKVEELLSTNVDGIYLNEKFTSTRNFDLTHNLYLTLI